MRTDHNATSYRFLVAMFFQRFTSEKRRKPEDDPQQDESSDVDDVQMPNKKVEEISVAIYEKDGVSVAVPTEEHDLNHFIRDDEIVAEPFSVDKIFSIMIRFNGSSGDFRVFCLRR